MPFLWGNWYPYFEHLVTSLGFKARVGSLICTWQRPTFPQITSGVTPADLLTASIAAGGFPHMRVSAVGDLPHNNITKIHNS